MPSAEQTIVDQGSLVVMVRATIRLRQAKLQHLLYSLDELPHRRYKRGEVSQSEDPAVPDHRLPNLQ